MIIRESVPNSDAYAGYSYRVRGINERNAIGDHELHPDDPSVSDGDLYEKGHMTNRDLAMSGHMFNSDSMTKRPTDAEAENLDDIVEKDDLEGVERYNVENYDLAKIQQSGLQPASFTTMGAGRYRGNWQKKCNPTLSIQGTSDYVEQSMANTNELE